MSDISFVTKMLQHQLLHAQQMYLVVKRDILYELVSFKKG